MSIEECLSRGDYNEAYCNALSKSDPFVFVRLIGKTGIVLDELDLDIIENVLSKAAELIISGEFIELLINWIVVAIDKKYKLSNKLKRTLIRSISTVCENEKRIDEMQISEANRVLNILKLDIKHH